MWNGERLLPKAFVEFVAMPAPAWPEPVYGGLFWVNVARADGRPGSMYSLPPDTYYANGAGYQRTFIVPSRELVIVIVIMSHRAGDTLSPGRDRRAHRAFGLAVKAVDPSWSWSEPPPSRALMPGWTSSCRLSRATRRRIRRDLLLAFVYNPKGIFLSRRPAPPGSPMS